MTSRLDKLVINKTNHSFEIVYSTIIRKVRLVNLQMVLSFN